jgi:hypothetical protein
VRATAPTSLKVLALAVIQFITFSVAAAVAIPRDGAPQSDDAGRAAASLFAVCLLNTGVLSYIIARSRWRGWRLVAAIFVAFYGTMTFMGQIESAVFITRLPEGMLPRLFLMGAIVAAFFSPAAVVVLGKWKRHAQARDTEPNRRLVMSPAEWAWKLAVIAAAYVTLYFTFGYYVAWRNPAVREYYGGTDPGSFTAQMSSVAGGTPWLIPFQILRALLWVAIALPVIRMMRGKWQETALALGLLFGVVMNAQLLLPNPYMPEPVRMAHLAETASSNFLFGLLVGWLLSRGRAPANNGR